MRFTLVRLGLDRAQFLGVDWLLEHVKGVAHSHIRADEVVETEPPHVAFDLEHGGLEQALSSGVLPARFFGPAKTGSKRVKQTIPAGEHDAIMFDSRTPAGQTRTGQCPSSDPRVRFYHPLLVRKRPRWPGGGNPRVNARARTLRLLRAPGSSRLPSGGGAGP